MSHTRPNPSGSLGTAPPGNENDRKGIGPGKVRGKMVVLFALVFFADAGLTLLLSQHPRAILAVSLGGLVLGIAFIIAFSGMITRPIVQMTRTAEKLANGDLHQRARVYGRDEVGLLARTFNAMVDSLERTIHGLEVRNRTLEKEAANRAAQMEKDAAERIRIEKELRLARVEIDRSVDNRTADLARANDELHGKVLETRRSEDYLQSNLERLERSLEGTFRAMSRTLELREPYMAGHQHRTAALAEAIAREMNMSWDVVEGLRFAGLIHDIGKITTPIEIMTKPGQLSKTELQLIKEHPRVGYEIVKDIAFPWPVAHIILQHHERLDGSGYPEGLLGDAILPEARILGVADTVEAVCSLRPYRPAVGIEKALEEVRKGRGIRFDTRVVDACIKLFREGRFSFRTEPEAPLSQ
jgi:putative nucleotidyltransferase with HDIG domain